MTPESRASLDREVLARLGEVKLPSSRVITSDLWAGLAVFWLVFFTALPAVVPFLVVRDAHVALRASNAVLIGLLFFVGWRWAAFAGANRWVTGLFDDAARRRTRGRGHRARRLIAAPSQAGAASDRLPRGDARPTRATEME